MADLLAALKRASRELERYVDLQQTLDYIEYAAKTQKELDAINAVIAEAESAAEPGEARCSVCNEPFVGMHSCAGSAPLGNL